MKTTIAAIEAELDRLDASDSETNASGICVSAVDDLPRGWVRLCDGTAEVFGPAEEVLAALREVEYDRSATVEQEGETETVQRDNGWELAWAALAFSDKAPRTSRDWPEELIRYEQLEPGGCNDNPNTLVTVETNGGTRFAAGPHGVSCCALEDWDGDLAMTRAEAIADGCEVAEKD